MNKFAFIFFVLFMSLFLFQELKAQEEPGKIILERSNLGFVYKKDGQVLKNWEVLQQLKSNETAFKEIKIANRKLNTSYFLKFGGGFFLLLPLATILTDNSPGWAALAVGSSLILISIPVEKSFVKQAEKALSYYNSESSSTKTKFNPEFSLGIAPGTIKINMRF